ncbi:MAG: hypothetical protein AAF219_10925 [Myxococcota bacterium]
MINELFVLWSLVYGNQLVDEASRRCASAPLSAPHSQLDVKSVSYAIQNASGLLRRKSRIGGFFLWNEAAHQDGLLYSSPLSVYEGSVGNTIVVDFQCDNEVRHLLHRREVELVGTLEDICDEEDQLGLSAHCHSAGTVLRLRVESIAEVFPHRYSPVRGEINREVVSSPFPRARVSRKAGVVYEKLVKEWLRLVATDWVKASPRDGMYRYILKNQYRGPLGSRLAFDRRRYAVFGEEEVEGTERSVYVCYCLEQSCDDEWPIAVEDAMSSVETYMCEFFSRSSADSAWVVDGINSAL